MASNATTTGNNNRPVVDVTITSDLVCPWCFVGLRKLEQAAERANVQANVVWKPYQLRPNTPEDGQEKGGTPADRVGLCLKRAGEQVGINFTGLTDKTPNTQLFHAVMKVILDEQGPIKQTEFQVAVFEAYFTNGIFPDKAALIDAATSLGIGNTVASFLNDTDRVKDVRQQVAYEAWQASRNGVSGVPFFEFNGEPAFSGAQDVATFEAYLKEYAKY